jgi:hypothetical protein
VEPTLLATVDTVGPTAGTELATVDTAPVAAETPAATLCSVVDTVPAGELDGAGAGGVEGVVGAVDAGLPAPPGVEAGAGVVSEPGWVVEAPG